MEYISSKVCLSLTIENVANNGVVFVQITVLQLHHYRTIYHGIIVQFIPEQFTVKAQQPLLGVKKRRGRRRRSKKSFRREIL